MDIKLRENNRCIRYTKQGNNCQSSCWERRMDPMQLMPSSNHTVYVTYMVMNDDYINLLF